MVDVSIDRFPPGPLGAANGSTISMPYAPIDIVRGAVTVYRPVPPLMLLPSLMERGATALRVFSALDGLNRSLGLFAKRPLRTSSIFGMLDGTEKGHVSYSVGMGMAHLLCKDLLHIVRLGHLDRLLVVKEAKLVAGKSRPDLVGHDGKDNWAVIEAKGRSNGVGNALVTKAKAQAQNVAAVGSSPTTLKSSLLRVASLTDLRKDPLHVTFVDPPSSDEEAGELTRVLIDPIALTRGYYRLVDEAAEFAGKTRELPQISEQLGVRGARLPGSVVWIGLAELVRAALDGPDDGLFARLDAIQTELADWRLEMIATTDGDRFTSVGPDGFVVHLQL